MCGIAGVYLRDPDFGVAMDDMLTTLTDEIETRGRHATGYVALTPEGMGQWQKAAVPASKFNVHRQPVPFGTRVLIAHTRLSTQGDPGFMENNHPIRRGPFYIVHNGHVNNDFELFRNAERNRYGQVDSEAIAARLASFGDLSKLDEVMKEIRGAAAVAAVDERDCSRLALARGDSSPLWVYGGRRIVIFASTKEAVVKTHERHVGRLSEDRLFYFPEGQMIEYGEDKAFVVKHFEVKRPIYTSWHEGDDRPWRTTTYKGTTTYRKGSTTVSAPVNGQKALPLAASSTRNFVRDLEYGDIIANENGFLDCENCSKPTHWDDLRYYWEPVERLTFGVCPECYEALNEEDKELADEWARAKQEAIEDGTITIEELEEMEGISAEEAARIANQEPLPRDDVIPGVAEESSGYDDFDGANRSIVTQFLRQFL